jgi:hypothetical protein
MNAGLCSLYPHHNLPSKVRRYSPKLPLLPGTLTHLTKSHLQRFPSMRFVFPNSVSTPPMAPEIQNLSQLLDIQNFNDISEH